MERKARFNNAKRKLSLARLQHELQPTTKTLRALRQAEKELGNVVDGAFRRRGGCNGYRTATRVF